MASKAPTTQQKHMIALKLVKAEMEVAVQRAIVAFNSGADSAERSSRIIQQVGLWLPVEQSKAAGAKKRVTVNPCVYNELMTMKAELDAATTKVDAACLEAEQCARRFTAMMQTELPRQERARLEKSKREVVEELQQIKRHSVTRQKEFGELLVFVRRLMRGRFVPMKA